MRIAFIGEVFYWRIAKKTSTQEVLMETVSHKENDSFSLGMQQKQDIATRGEGFKYSEL